MCGIRISVAITSLILVCVGVCVYARLGVCQCVRACVCVFVRVQFTYKSLTQACHILWKDLEFIWYRNVCTVKLSYGIPSDVFLCSS